ncbi:MAG: UbiD family decarboxylase [Deltaproteobacteria bacterium]|nr:UbiD family decarboxylase [Deltaproteobacteria bacterium]
MPTATGAPRSFREAIEFIEKLGELVRIRREVDPLLEIPALMVAASKLKPIPALLCESVKGHPGVQAAAAVFADQLRGHRLVGFPESQHASKLQYLDALDASIPPILVKEGPCQERVVTRDIDLERVIPLTYGALHVTRRYYQPVVCLKHPKTGVVNTSLYRACVQGPDRVTINIRWDQHGGLYLKQAQELGAPLPVAMCLGVPPAVYLAGVSKLPYGCPEMGFAGALMGEPVELVRCKTIDLEVPATAEIVVEGEIRPPYETGFDGPWPEYLGYLGMEIYPPLVHVTAVTHRERPVTNIFVPGAAPHLLGIGSQAQFFRHLRSLYGEFVVDAHLPPRTVWHHAIIKVRKTEAHHEGLQLNVGLAAFAFANPLDKVTIVDEDINIYDFAEVEWAICTRCNPARQVHILPQARTHQNNPIGGIRELEDGEIVKAKMIIDATIPWRYRAMKRPDGLSHFSRSEWPPVELAEYLDPEDRKRWYGR